MTKNAITIDNLTDSEFDTLMLMVSEALDRFFNGQGWRTAHRNVIRWCARRNISEEVLWAWLDD